MFCWYLSRFIYLTLLIACLWRVVALVKSRRIIFYRYIYIPGLLTLAVLSAIAVFAIFAPPPPPPPSLFS